MSALEELLARNAERARPAGEELPALPRRRLVVLTCVDHRVDPAHVLGLELGDAVVVRNPGGRVTPAFLRDLAILARVFPQIAEAGERFELDVRVRDGGEPFTVEEGREALVLAFDVAAWLDGVALDAATAGDDGVIVLSASSNASLLADLEANTARTLALYEDLDADGELYVAGRVDDMIISGGENIYPTEGEDVFVRHPQVQEACVVGRPDDRPGKVVTASGVPRRAADGPSRRSAEDLDQFSREARDFAAFRRPRRYEFVEALPKSPTGKLLRRRLLEG